MKLIISFSGRENGNCKALAEYNSKINDKIIDFKSLDIHGCSNCEYECFTNKCKYRGDDIYSLYNKIANYDKVILIVPIYCGNPSSLYYIFNERSQDYFMHNEEKYNDIVNRLFFICVYGSCKETPGFLEVFENWFDCADSKKHILGIERHKYNNVNNTPLGFTKGGIVLYHHM